MTVVYNILCLLVFKINLSVILTRMFPQTELSPPPPPQPKPEVSDLIHKVHWTIPLLNIDKFERRFHIIEKHDERPKLII